MRNASKAESGKQKFILAFSFPDFSFPFALAGSALLVSYLLLRAISTDPLDEAAGLNLDERNWLAGIELGGILCYALVWAFGQEIGVRS